MKILTIIAYASSPTHHRLFRIIILKLKFKWTNTSHDIVNSDLIVCGQTSDVTPEDISCFKEGKACHEGLEKLKELWAVDPDNIDYGALKEITDFDTLEYIPEEMPEEEEPDLEQEEENELVVHLEEDEDEDLEEEAEEPVGGLFGTKRKRVDNNNSVCKRKK